MSDNWNSLLLLMLENVSQKNVCGMLIKKEDNIIYGPCRNLAKENPKFSFVIDPDDWAHYEDQGEVIGIIHSHPDG